MSNEENDITLLGDEEEIEAREAGFLPGRKIEPAEEQPADDAAFDAELEAELEAGDDPIAEIAGQQAEMLENLGLDEEPGGWIAEPESLEQIAANREILNQLLGLDGLSASEREEVVDDALWRYQMGEASGAAIADELGSYDPKAADAFVKAWQADQRSQMSADQYAETQARIQAMVERAKQYAAEAEEAKQAEAEAAEAFNVGVERFRASLGRADKALEQRAFEIYSEMVSNPSFDADATWDADSVAQGLRFALGVAQQMSHAQASAAISAEWDALDTAAGFMDSLDNRKSFGEHLAGEIRKRLASGQMTTPRPTRGEQVAALHEDFDRAERDKWKGWNGRLAPSHSTTAPSAPAEPKDGDPFSLETELERRQCAGWQIGGR